MNSKQKLVQQQFLNNETTVLKRLKSIYNASLGDVTDKISSLEFDIDRLQFEYDWSEDGTEKVKLQSQIQSKIYQKRYQEALQKQLDGILQKMNNKAYKTVSDYLNECYTDGFIGTVFDLHGQGIPLIMPIDQEALVRAVQLDSKISKNLYTKMGENVTKLKRDIAAKVSRGIASGMSYEQVAQQIRHKMVGTYNTNGGALARALTIARTEGHRIQVQAGMDACYKAKDMGVDVVKQWDSTMDKKTRESHQKVDGEIRELDEPFSNGLDCPGDPDGGAAEVINCRCALLQRAKWALDDEELESLKEKAAFFGLDKTENFEDFKKKYIDATPTPQTTVKKEYLTKKKLEQKLQDIDNEMNALQNKYPGMDIMDIMGADAAEDQKKWVQLETLKADYEEKLNKKLVASETKKLKKEQILLEDQLNNYQVDTYSGIWKDDVTTVDWSAKKDAIPKKKAYFQQQLQYATDPADIQKWNNLIQSLDDFDSKGAAYYDIQKKLNKTKADLTKLQKNGKIKGGTSDAYSQDRKDAALWAKQVKDADDQCRDKSGEVWRNGSKTEQYAAYDYTCGSGKFNRPLSGFEKPYSEPGTGWEQKYFKGVNKVWIDFEGAGDEIRDMTNLISRSTYDFDMWLQRGCDGNALESFLGITPNTFEYMTESELQQFIGRSNRMYSFTSTGVAKGQGFSSKPIIINIYAPKGTQMLYAEPFSHFGYGGKLNWDGISKQSSFGSEAEMIIQRGASYEITKIEKSNGRIYIDMDVHPEDGYDLFQQDPSEWKGSTKKGR